MKRIILLLIFSELLAPRYAQNTQFPDWKTYMQEYIIHDIADGGEYLWLVASENTEVIKFEKSTGKATSFGFSDFKINYGDWITKIECDNNGTPYVGTFVRTFKMNDNNQWIRVHPDGTADILVSKNGDIWLANHFELIKYQGDSICEIFNLSSDFEIDLYLTSLTEDNEQNLWAINYNLLIFYGDLVKFDRQKWDIYHMPEYYNDDFFVPESGFPKINLKYQFFINDIKIDKYNKIWMSKTKVVHNGELETLSNGSRVYPSKSELVSFEDSSWASFNPPMQAHINSIAPDNRSIRCGTNHGLMQFYNFRWIVFDINNSEIPSNHINSVLIDNQGTKWLGTDNGLISFKENQLKMPVEQEPKLSSEIDLFPNPAKDYIILKLPGNIQKMKVEILTIQGKTIKTFNVDNNKKRLDIKELSQGTYLVDSNEKQLHFKKVRKTVSRHQN